MAAELRDSRAGAAGRHDENFIEKQRNFAQFLNASWTNMVECFFSILGKRGLSQSVHKSKRELKQFLLDYIDHHNENRKRFVWTKGPEKLQRIIEATKEYQAAHPRKPQTKRRKKRASRQPNTIKD